MTCESYRYVDTSLCDEKSIGGLNTAEKCDMRHNNNLTAFELC